MDASPYNLVACKSSKNSNRSRWVVGSNSSYKPITNTAWVRVQLCKLQKGCTWIAAASDKVYQLLAQDRWFSPASSTTKTGRHDIAEILLKVALKHQKSNQINQQIPHLWTSYITTFQTLQSSLIFVDCFKHRFPTKWPGSTVYIQN